MPDHERPRYQFSADRTSARRTLRYRDIAGLNEGDVFRDGKLYDRHGNEVPIMEPDEGHLKPAKVPAMH